MIGEEEEEEEAEAVLFDEPVPAANIMTPPIAATEPSHHPVVTNNVSDGGAAGIPGPDVHVHFPPRTHTINIDTSRGGRIRINALQSAGSPTWGGHVRSYSNNNTATNNGTPAHIISHGQPLLRMLPARPMLPPLEPKPMPHQTTSVEIDVNSSENNDEGDDKMKSKVDMKKFECAICFEYMNYPVGCGSCQTRFCMGCLQRVLRQSGDNGSQSTDPPNSAKCPHCRSIFTPQSIVQDNKLRKEINDCADTVTCPFRGCGAELRIGQLKAHEASCPYMRMRCRFADWGCDWVGERKFMEDHDANQCEFRGGLGKLVETYRQCDAHTGHALHQHHLQIAATSQMLSLHSRQMMLIRNRNAGNVVDVLQLAFEASLFPGRFCAMREVWMSLIGQHDAQCLGCNIMLFVPSVVLILKEGLNGLKMLSSVQLETISGDELWLLVDTFLLSFISVSLGIMCLSCFFIDNKSSHEWATYNIRNVVLGPILRDIASVCIAMTNYCAITFKSLPAGIILWHFTTIVTVLYTSFVSCIMAKSNNLPSTASAMRASRAWPVVAFGLRYGFLIATCGVSSSISAVTTMRLLKHRAILSPRTTLDDSECFINQLSTSWLIVMSGLATAFNYATELDDSSLRKFVFDWMFATAALAYVNVLVFLLDAAGRALGEVNFNNGTKILMQARQSSGSTLPNIKPTSVGCSLCGVCLFLLLFIATA